MSFPRWASSVTSPNCLNDTRMIHASDLFRDSIITVSRRIGRPAIILRIEPTCGGGVVGLESGVITRLT